MCKCISGGTGIRAGFRFQCPMDLGVRIPPDAFFFAPTRYSVHIEILDRETNLLYIGREDSGDCSLMLRLFSSGVYFVSGIFNKCRPGAGKELMEFAISDITSKGMLLCSPKTVKTPNGFEVSCRNEKSDRMHTKISLPKREEFMVSSGGSVFFCDVYHT